MVFPKTGQIGWGEWIDNRTPVRLADLPGPGAVRKNSQGPSRGQRDRGALPLAGQKRKALRGRGQLLPPVEGQSLQAVPATSNRQENEKDHLPLLSLAMRRL